jgi:predicted alpha/beta-fold hydrolase
LYEKHFVRRLKRRMRHKASLFPAQFPIDEMRNIRTVRDFDEVITARFCGFEGAADYYARSSAKRLIAAIRRPTLILTAEDDPVVPFKSFLDSALRENPHITFLATRHGGHCAFISNQGGDERFWSEARIVEFCRSHCG